MTLDNMTGITEGSYTGFCKRQLITCNFVKACNGVCPFEDALKHADKIQTINEQHTVDHDRDWIIGCIEHDGFIKTDRFDKANQIIFEALQGWIPCSREKPDKNKPVLISGIHRTSGQRGVDIARYSGMVWQYDGFTFPDIKIEAWMPLPTPYKGGDDE